MSARERPLPALRGTRAVVLRVTGKSVAALAAAAELVVLARLLGVEGRGAVAAAIAPLMLISTLFALGLPDTVTYFIAKAPEASRATLARARSLVLGLGVSGTIAVVLIAIPASSGNRDLFWLISLASLGVLPAMLAKVMRSAGFGLHSWALTSVETGAVGVLRVLVLATLAVVGSLNEVTATAVIAGSSLFSVAILAFVPLEVTSPERAPSHRTLMTFGFATWLTSVSSVILLYLDQVLIVPLSSERELGIYSVSISITQLVLLVAYEMRSVALADQSREPKLHLVPRAARFSCAVTLAVATSVAVAAPLLVPAFFGIDFRDSVIPTWILLLYAVCYAPGLIAGAYLLSHRKLAVRSWAVFAGMVVNVLLLLALVPPFGSIGAALAMLIGGSIPSFIFIGYMKRVYGHPISSYLIPRPSDLLDMARHLVRLARSIH